MIVSDYLKLIFIHVHRTGGTTIENLLKDHWGNNFKQLSQHENARTAAFSLLNEHNDYYAFGFTRNPWERILSWYSLIHKNCPISLAEERKRFESFISSNAAADFTTHYFHYNSLDYFTNKDGELKVDKIFRHENFVPAVEEIMERFNLFAAEIPVLNSSGVKDYHKLYTRKSQQLIAEKCSLDIEYFGYVF